MRRVFGQARRDRISEGMLGAVVRIKLPCPRMGRRCAGGRVRDRATIIQKKTGRPVQFEITEQIRAWLPEVEARNGRHLFPSRFRAQPHVSTRQYAWIVHAWVESAGLDSSAYGTHSMRRTKAAQIYKKTGNLRAVQLLFGHTKLESTVRYLGIEVGDALSISEQVVL
jgi:site-specific recombinase XerD